MEWLARGTYTYEPLHPPLARVAVALGPYVAGLRLQPLDNTGSVAAASRPYWGGSPWGPWMTKWVEGNLILYSGGNYLRNLTLARLGVLPFFVLAA